MSEYHDYQVGACVGLARNEQFWRSAQFASAHLMRLQTIQSRANARTDTANAKFSFCLEASGHLALSLPSHTLRMCVLSLRGLWTAARRPSIVLLLRPTASSSDSQLQAAGCWPSLCCCRWPVQAALFATRGPKSRLKKSSRRRASCERPPASLVLAVSLSLCFDQNSNSLAKPPLL